MTSPREISPHGSNIDPGWPRPYYRLNDKIEYVQWITGTASGQITSCSDDKTYAAGHHHLCTSCGEKMERGLLFDKEWINAQRDRPSYAHLGNTGSGGNKLGFYDSHYGGSICYRCAVFALKHCPLFSTFNGAFGDTLQWRVTSSGQDFQEGDDTSVVELVNNNLPTVTSGEIKKDVREGNLHLMKVDNLGDLQNTRRPVEFYIREVDIRD